MVNSKIIICSGALSLILLGGCTSSTNQQLNNPIVAQKNDVKPESLNTVDGLKRLVAIGRFSDETKRGNSIFVDNNNNRLGKQASDILSARLTSTGKFIMLERPDIQLLASESKTFDSTKVGSDYLIIGSVSEFGRRTESEVGVFSRNKIQVANATVNVRLVDVRTGQIIYSEEASGEARTEANRVLGVGQTAAYDTSLDDKAVSAAISKLVANIMNNLMDNPWQAYLIKGEEDSIFMTGGSNQGVKVGDEFAVIAPGKKVKNPQTGFMISMPGKSVGKVKVESFIGSGNDELSVVSVTGTNLDLNQISNYVVREIKRS
ncbi:CsgG/HfaB family protein [Thalassotalea ponticola]|uniref:CsgG/HfaB family protein n=1 Tax=Thalassotalea ponticola TaxID=1523392 RepID=UPI0025B5E41A|nr:CsgG/HfaB family protein [Thalassotalea ponticola]MDN3651320.1 CsgG/HfaB family protein [Thalassotalea ponticola]